jgi:presenilin-like A22 family membrane protease
MPKTRLVFLYWIGVAMALMCVILVVASHWARVWSFQIAGIELPWLAGGVAIAAILLYEFCTSARAIPIPKPPAAEPQMALEFKEADETVSVR